MKTDFVQRFNVNIIVKGSCGLGSGFAILKGLGCEIVFKYYDKNEQFK
jgi:hypothetical protein